MEQSTLLPSRAWAPVNHAALTQWLQPPAAQGPRVAVFDFDNTCIFNDVGDATFCHQLDTLAFRLPPDALGPLLPASVNGMTHLQNGMELDDVVHDIEALYTALWPHIQKRDAAPSTLHTDLKVKLTAMYRGLEKTKEIGSKFAYQWIAGWLAGYTREEVHALAADAIKHVAFPPKLETWESSDSGKTGRLTVQWKRGVHALPEIPDLMRAMTDAGMTVYIVTASAEPIVQGAVTALNYPVPHERIIGMRLRQSQGVYEPMLDDAYPATNRHGKVLAIERFMPAPPIFVAGDYTTDYEMLTHFDATQIRLVINRCCQDEMQRLYEAALQPYTKGPRTLLQGRDENKGTLRPTQESILLGEEVPRLR